MVDEFNQHADSLLSYLLESGAWSAAEFAFLYLILHSHAALAHAKTLLDQLCHQWAL